MALSDRLRERIEERREQSAPHRGEADGYGSGTAADIARYGVYGKAAKPPQPDGVVPAAPPPDGVVSAAPPPADVGFLPPAPGEEAYRRRSRRKSPRGKASRAKVAVDEASVDSTPVAGSLSLARTDALEAAERRTLRCKVVVCLVIAVVLAYVAVGFTGAQGNYFKATPLETTLILGEWLRNFIANTIGIFDATDVYSELNTWHFHAYLTVPAHVGVILITIVCAVLLAVSGMLYQNVFKNPIAGPGMLGVSSGVTLGMMLLTYVYGADALGMITQRYVLCYSLGAAVLLFVILAGRKLSGKGRPYDIVTMLLIGMIFSQLVGFVVQFMTLFVMDTTDYNTYLSLSQMLQVDTSLVSWIALGVACVVSLVPVWLLRFRLNALAFDEQEVKLLGINMAGLRAVALICGAIMILAAQIHIGAVSMVSLIVPFLSRAWFGCEFRKQLAGSICISIIFMLVCRMVVDLVPFVGDGIGIGSAVSLVALPVFLLLMARHLRSWE